MIQLPDIDQSTPAEFQKIPLLFLLKDIYQKNISGAFECKKDSSVRKIYFKSNTLVHISSNQKTEIPGFFLLKKKVITEAQFQIYFEKISAQPKINHWDALSSLFQIPKEKINIFQSEFLEVFFNFIVFDIAQTIHFDPSDIFFGSSQALSIFKLLSFALQKTKPEQTIAKFLNLSPDCGVFLNLPLNNKTKDLDPDDRGVLTVIEHNSKLSEVYSSSLLDPRIITQRIYLLYFLGFINLQSKEAFEIAQWTKTLSKEQKEIRDKILTTVSHWDSFTYYDLLEIQEETSSFEIPKKLKQWIEKYNAPSSEKLFLPFEVEIYKKFLNLFVEAKTVISDPQKRSLYHDQLLSSVKGSLKLKTTSSTPNVLKPSNLDALFSKLSHCTFYELLGLDMNAQHHDIRNAYRNQSKKYHPDLFLSKKDEFIKAQEVYKKIVQAYSVLKDLEKRKLYDQTLIKKTSTATSSSLPKTPNGIKFMNLAQQDQKMGNVKAALQNLYLGLQVEPDCLFFKTQIELIQKK